MALLNHLCWATFCLFNAIHGQKEPQSTMTPLFYDAHQRRSGLETLELNTDNYQKSKELINYNKHFTEQSLSENVGSDDYSKPTTIDTIHQYDNSVLTTAISFRKKSFTSDLNDAEIYDIGTKIKYIIKKNQKTQNVTESMDNVEGKDSKVTGKLEISASENNLSLLPARRFYNGHKTKIKHFPFLVTVHVFNKFVCGGSIIKSNLVITAASCLKKWQEWLRQYLSTTTTVKTTTTHNVTTYNVTTNNVTTHNVTTNNVTTHNVTTNNVTTHNVTTDNVTTIHNFNHTHLIIPKHITVRIGTNYYRLGGKVVEVTKAHFHPFYREKTLQNNLVILELGRNLSFEHRNVKKINIRTIATAVSNGTNVTIVGWGAKLYHNKVYNALWNLIHKAGLNVSDINQCIRKYTPIFVNKKSNFCASNKDNEGACIGDAGDPAVADGVLVGVTSFGSPKCGAPNATTVFTNLGSYLLWINEFVNITEEEIEEVSRKPEIATSTASSTGYKWPCLRNGSLFDYSGEKCQVQTNIQLDKLREYQKDSRESREYRRALENSTQAYLIDISEIRDN